MQSLGEKLRTSQIKIMDINNYSRVITQDESQPAAQAMLYGAGLSELDMSKAQVGIVSTGFEGNTCNMHLNSLSQDVKKGVIANGLVGLIFHTIGVSDGISTIVLGGTVTPLVTCT